MPFLECRWHRSSNWVSREFFRNGRIADLVVVKVHDVQTLAVFHFTFAEIMQIRLPLVVLLEVFGGVL